MSQPSPFFRPNDHSRRYVVVQQRTPGGRLRNISKQDAVNEEKSGLFGTGSNLMNAIVGSGIVGIPYAVRQAGFVTGIFLIVLCAIATEKSLRLLIFTAKHIHVGSYETLAEACFGIVGFRFIAINMFIMAYGAMISYLMIIKESFGTVILNGREADTELMRRTLLIVISMITVLPLSCKRDMAALAVTSRANVVIDTALVLMVAYNAFHQPTILDHSNSSWWFHGDTVFVGLGVLSFAFVCQHSAFIIAGSLENPTSKRWSKVTSGALSCCGVLALFCGISGYWGYREHTKGNILSNLDPASPTANVARTMLGVAMLFVFPLEAFVTRHCAVVLLFSGRAAHEGDDTSVLARRDRRVGLTVALYLLALVPAAWTNDLGPVLALTGAIGGSSLSYIGPGAVYLGVHGERFLELVKEHYFQTIERPVESTQAVALGETTPLQQKDDKQFKSAQHKVLYFASAMPLWCWIAQYGSDKVQIYAHDMALKSPHPIRIGDVEYKRIPANSPIPKNYSLTSLPSFKDTMESMIKASPGGDINKQISKEILQRQQREPDPQKDPPSWRDFRIAMAYFIFGWIALFAGIASIFHQES